MPDPASDDTLRRIVKRMVETGESRETIAQVVKRYDLERQIPPPPDPSSAEQGKADRDALANRLMGNTYQRPDAAHMGGMLGALAVSPFIGPMGVPAAMAASGAAAAAGAGTGALGKQLVTGEADPHLGKTMAIQGAFGAGGEGAGRLEGAIANRAVPAILKGIYRPSPSIQKEFPDVVETIRREQIPIGPGGAETANTRMKAASAEAQAMVDAANPTARPIHPREISQEFRPLLDEATNRAKNAGPTAQADMEEIIARARGLRQHGPQDLGTNQVLKQQAQTDANKAFRAQDRGATINDTTAKLDKAVAIGRQKAGEARFPSLPSTTGGPGINPLRAANAKTQSLMGLEDTLADAQRRNSGMVGFNPFHLASDLFPGASSTMTFGADAISKTLGQPTARALRQALLAMLAGSGQSNDQP